MMEGDKKREDQVLLLPGGNLCLIPGMGRGREKKGVGPLNNNSSRGRSIDLVRSMTITILIILYRSAEKQ
jgi:hypothetical protein